jgi:hypothetical protein
VFACLHAEFMSWVFGDVPPLVLRDASIMCVSFRFSFCFLVFDVL